MAHVVTGNFERDAVWSAVTTLLWTKKDDNGNPLEETYDTDDVTSDVRKFLIENLSVLFEDEQVLEIIERHNIDAESFGHCFVLTANGHGAGFEGRDYGNDGSYLTSMVKPIGPIDLFVTTTNLIGMN